MPTIGSSCHELRITDRGVIWRIVVHVAPDAVVILEVFSKKTQTLPPRVADAAKRRLREYLRLTKGD